MAGASTVPPFDCRVAACCSSTEYTVLLFVGHLAQEGLAHSSIRVYLAAGLHNEFSQQLTPRQELVLKGIEFTVPSRV